jgi:hypothetical protein
MWQLGQQGLLCVLGGVTDPLPVLLFGSFIRIRHWVACSLGCQNQSDWSIQSSMYIQTSLMISQRIYKNTCRMHFNAKDWRVTMVFVVH